MKNLLIFAFALILIFVFSISPLAKTATESQATPDLNLRDSSNSWVYWVIGISATAIAVVMAVVITKKVR